MIIKKSAGLMTDEEAKQLSEACTIHLVKEVRLKGILDTIKNYGFFDGIAEGVSSLGNIIGKENLEEVKYKNEQTPNRGLEFYTIDPKDYNWIIESSKKLGRKLTILQLVQMGLEFDLDNLVALVPIATGMSDMRSEFKQSVVSKFVKTNPLGNRGLNTDNDGETNIKIGVGAYATSLYDLSRGVLYGANDFKPIMDKVADVVGRFDVKSVGFVANADKVDLYSFFDPSYTDKRYDGAAIVDLAPYNERMSRARSLELKLNYDFLDKYFSPKLKAQMLRKIRKFITRRGLEKSGVASSRDLLFQYMDSNPIGGIRRLNNYPYAVFAFSNKNINADLEEFESFLKGLSELSIDDEAPYSIPEEIEEEITDKLGVGLLNYYENNGLTRPITSLEGRQNRFRSKVIRSIIEDAIASSLPGFSQPTGAQRGFRLEKSYTGMPTTLKDLTNIQTFNDLLKVKGEIPMYVSAKKKQTIYLEEFKKALSDMEQYFRGTNFARFIDIAGNMEFSLRTESSFKETAPLQYSFLLKMRDSSRADIGMTVIFEFKFSLPDFQSNTETNLILEEVDVERYMDKTTQSRYTVDVNKIDDLNLEMVDIVRRVYEPKRFYSGEETQQFVEPRGKKLYEGALRQTSPTMTAKGLMTKIFREQASNENTIVLQDLTIDNLTGRMLGVLYYPGITGSGFYISLDDRKSGLVRTRTERREIFVVCTGSVTFGRDVTDPNVSESACSYSATKADFEGSMDDATTAFLVAGTNRDPYVDIKEIDFEASASRPGDIAHIEVTKGQKAKLEYELQGGDVSAPSSNLEVINIQDGLMNQLTDYLKTRFSYTTPNTKFSSIKLKVYMNAYQRTLTFNIRGYYSGDEGPNDDVINVGFMNGKISAENFQSLQQREESINEIFDSSLIDKIANDLEEKTKRTRDKILDYVKGPGKKPLLDKIRRRSYGYELGQTSRMGQEFADRKFRGKIDE